MLTQEILLVQNKRLREENEELREVVRQLTAKEDSPLPDDLRHLTKREEEVFRALMAGHGIVRKEFIYHWVYGDDSTVDTKVIEVFISHVRRKMIGTDWSITTHWGKGFSLHRAESIAA